MRGEVMKMLLPVFAVHCSCRGSLIWESFIPPE
jgi:hypothetical protein